MAEDEREAARMSARAEEILALFDKAEQSLARDVARVRAKHLVELEAQELEASRAGNLKEHAAICRTIATVFDATGLHAEAERYRAAAKDCTDRQRRRTWAENHKQGRHKR